MNLFIYIQQQIQLYVQSQTVTFKIPKLVQMAQFKKYCGAFEESQINPRVPRKISWETLSY
jgi:hypothetical protein